MTMMLLALVVVGITAYIWSSRGFFSAMIHMVCTFAAGAIAFGVWEPLGFLLLSVTPNRGFGDFLGGMAWGLALGVPFALALAILRAVVDKLLPANAQCDSVGDYVGGGVCGLVAGVISAGIMVLSIGYLRLAPDFAGYRPVVFSQGVARGSLENSQEKMAPWVDRITAGLYSHLSLTTMRTDEPLARWRPDLVSEGGALRTTYDGKSRNTVKQDDFRFLGWYRVGNPSAPQKLDTIMADSWNPVVQKAAELDGEPITSGYLAGFIITFNASSRERVGQTYVGNGQLRLVVQSSEPDFEDDTKALHPIAIITNTDDPTRVDYGRFRFSSDETYFSSLGAVADSNMAFEFAIPAGYHPLALYVKGYRVDLEGVTPKDFSSPGARDETIAAGNMEGMGGVGPRLDDQGNPIRAEQVQQWTGELFAVRNILPNIIQKGTEQGLAVVQEGRGWIVTDGEMKIFNDRLRNTGAGALPPNLQINRFAVTSTTVIVQLDISPDHRTPESFQKIEAADKNAPITLVDTNGVAYQCVGFWYKDNKLAHLRYTRGTPLRGLNDAPSVSSSNTDRTLVLIFAVNLGVEIKEFKIGGAVIDTYDPPKKCDQAQR